MHLIEKIYTWILKRHDFKGRYWLLKKIETIFNNGLFVTTAYGVSIKSNFRDTTWSLAYNGYSSKLVSDAVLHLPAGSCFIDIGANLGIFTLLAAKTLGHDGVVISFEPNRIVYGDLIANLNHNNIDCSNVVFNQGVTDNFLHAQLSIEEGHSGKAHINLEPGIGPKSLFTPLSSLAFLPDIIGKRHITIKIDVEGAEYGVLKSIFTDLPIGQIEKIIVEIDDSHLSRFNSTRKSLYELTESNGFKATINSDKKHYDEVFVKKVNQPC